MYHTPARPRHRGAPSPSASRQHQVPDGPIADLSALIEETKSDDWQRRILAFEELVAQIPTGSKYLEQTAWFNTPKTLWHLANPVSELLRDARSTVVRRACMALTELFNKCQQDARLLFKDIMGTILAVHAQTVQIIRQAVTTMVTESIPEVPCKSVMPFWMDRLKDKSPAVRDACSLYLGLALQSWTEEGYLTDEIWMQVGGCLLKTMRDPSPSVRTHAKSALENMRLQHPARWEALISDPNGPTAKDVKLQRWLRSLQDDNASAAEELSIASKYTYNSDSRFARPGMRISSPRIKFSASADDESAGERHARHNGHHHQQAAVPFSIAVTHREPPPPSNHQNARGGGGGLGPPVRPAGARTTTTTAPFSHVVNSPYGAAVVGTPPRPPGGGVARGQSPQGQVYSTLAASTAHPAPPAAELEYSESQTSDAAAIEDEGPFIASMQELKKHASKRRSRKSILMLERFRLSSRNLDEQDEEDNDNKSNNNEISPDKNKNENTTPNSNNSSPSHNHQPSSSSSSSSSPKRAPPPGSGASSAQSAPEHMVIAIRLLRAHKSHVDQVMETLKIEMDTLRDFDRLLEEPGRPTEDELLNYFESVELCLNQRLKVASALRSEMDRISQGEPE